MEKTIKRAEMAKRNKNGAARLLPTRRAELLELAKDKTMNELSAVQFECTETGVVFEFELKVKNVFDPQAEVKETAPKSELAPITLG